MGKSHLRANANTLADGRLTSEDPREQNEKRDLGPRETRRRLTRRIERGYLGTCLACELAGRERALLRCAKKKTCF